MRVLPGRPYPLGAGWDGEGVDFALFSDIATAWNLPLRSVGPDEESHRI